MTRLRFASPPPRLATEGLLTVSQAAELLQVSPRTIRGWLLKRRIAFIKLGRSVRIPRSELERLIEAGWVSRLDDGRLPGAGPRRDRPGASVTAVFPPATK